jgi:hypothetical protein
MCIGSPLRLKNKETRASKEGRTAVPLGGKTCQDHSCIEQKEQWLDLFGALLMGYSGWTKIGDLAVSRIISIFEAVHLRRVQ